MQMNLVTRLLLTCPNPTTGGHSPSVATTADQEGQPSPAVASLFLVSKQLTRPPLFACSPPSGGRLANSI